jgi:hypothetical protein
LIWIELVDSRYLELSAALIGTERAVFIPPVLVETAIIALGQTIAICFPVEQTDAAS